MGETRDGMMRCVVKNAGQVLLDTRERKMLEIEGGMSSSSGEWTTRDQSPSTLFTSQQNLLTDN